VSFGLLNNQPPFSSILLFSILSLPFYGDHYIPPPTICWCRFLFNPSIRGWLSAFWTI
jgi:hypothetical protein